METMNTVSDFLENRSFGRTCEYCYNTADYVGHGRYGGVYEAIVRNRGNFTGGRFVVVKVTHIGKNQKALLSAENWTKWQDRINMLLRLKHKNLAVYHKITIIKARGGASIELLMDHYRGGDLFSLLRKLETNSILLHLEEGARYAANIAEGLHYLHLNNIIHGDLKPGNVLVKEVESGQERLVVGDLDDFVQLQGNQTCPDEISQARGTYRYMSPEMLVKLFNTSTTEESIGRKTDIWSLGCILLAVADRVVGSRERRLQKDATKIEAGDKISDPVYMMKITEGYIPYCNDDIPKDLSACIRGCLRVNATERYSAQDVLNRLQLIVSSDSTRNMVNEHNISVMVSTVGTPSVPIQMDTSVVENQAFGANCQYQYEQNDFIGTGAFGVVYLAKVTTHGDYQGEEKAAVKIVHVPEEAFNPERLEQFKRLWLTLLNLRDSHLVTYYKVTLARARKGGGISVEHMMEYYDGGDLASLLEELSSNGILLNEAVALRYALEISEGLRFLHQNDIIHTNLNPRNIFIKQMENGHNRLAIGSLDNVVQMQRDITTSREVTHLRGTIRYMSPEMLRTFIAQKRVDPVGRKTDVWSLGCVVLEIASAAVGSNKLGWLQKGNESIEARDDMPNFRFAMSILDGYVPFVSDGIPSRFADCILRCLRFNSAERIGAADLAERLHNLASSYNYINST